MKYKGKEIEYVSSVMKFMVTPQVTGQAYPYKYYVSADAAKKAIDNAEEKRIAMAKAKTVAKPVNVFQVDSKYYGSNDEEKYFTKDHTIIQFKADGVGKNREYFFVAKGKDESYGAWRHGYERRFRFSEDGTTSLYDVKDKAKVQKILDKRNKLYLQQKAIEDKISDLDGAEGQYRLSKSDLLEKMGLPTDL